MGFGFVVAIVTSFAPQASDFSSAGLPLLGAEREALSPTGIFSVFLPAVSVTRTQRRRHHVSRASASGRGRPLSLAPWCRAGAEAADSWFSCSSLSLVPEPQAWDCLSFSDSPSVTDSLCFVFGAGARGRQTSYPSPPWAWNPVLCGRRGLGYERASCLSTSSSHPLHFIGGHRGFSCSLPAADGFCLVSVQGLG